jgi:hypothetical protein
MFKNSVGWAVELTGHPIDLDDLRETLQPPFDRWIEDYQSDEGMRPLLRTAAWASSPKQLPYLKMLPECSSVSMPQRYCSTTMPNW